MNQDNVKYPRNVINQVIARVDFIQPYANDIIFSSSVIDTIKTYYPVAEMDQLLRYGEITIPISTNQASPPPVRNTIHEGILKNFTTSNRKNKLSISNTHIVFSSGNYDTYEKFTSSVIPIIKSINPITAVRIGIRYINLFNSNTIRPLRSFFNQPYASYLSKNYIYQSECSMLRSMNLTEYELNDMKLSFRFGLYNSKYPNKISEMDFTLDFDCYTQETTTGAEQIIECFRLGHDEIQKLFESSITDKLREVLHNE